jgi:hypothetical protein
LLSLLCLVFSFYSLPYIFQVVLSFQDHRLLISRPPLLEGGAIPHVPISAAFEAPKTEDSHDGDEGKDSLERSSSMTSPPPALSEDIVMDKKRKLMAR